MHLPGSDTARLVLGTSHHLSGYLRPHAAQLMDKCVNMRSIWAERPHKPHLIPSWALKYQSVHSARYRSKSRKKAVCSKKHGVNMAREWWLQVSSKIFAWSVICTKSNLHADILFLCDKNSCYVSQHFSVCYWNPEKHSNCSCQKKH